MLCTFKECEISNLQGVHESENVGLLEKERSTKVSSMYIEQKYNYTTGAQKDCRF